MEDDPEKIKELILLALSHPEAEEGLFLENFYHLHEEDQRQRIDASELSILDALKELIAEGKVETDECGENVVFKLPA